MTPSVRVNYDAIAHLYDGQPYRAKSPDPELSTLISRRTVSNTLSILDIGCGTGNQLVANRTVVRNAQLVGLDRSLGMLRQARPKASDIAWVQADAAIMPLRADSFDFVTCQHVLHHVRCKEAMLREVLRVLRPGGRFVLRSLCPQESEGWLYYEYFPEARGIDLKDFWPPEQIITVMEAAGFHAVTAARQHLRYDQNLREWLTVVKRRDTCSQLTAIRNEAYAAGLRRLEQELADSMDPPVRADHLCLVTIRGDRWAPHSGKLKRRDHG